ncbi:aspartate kinase [Gallaecimonas pentaromativorans]|uniref:aspartate kinase n=1 Tax=Gallaecimonas pentaromativorans TaxID=584787 RepID=UPI00067EC52C|nr:aspartate kinase [Gallaecimonas pentaromativorans]MED5526389.1 aspartate kinase [Pseudomonadota bacterium]
MALLVQKFGGTSVGSLVRIEAVAERIIKSRRQGHDLVVVVSAMSGETNRLIAMAQALSPEPDRRELDVLLATGEQTTIALLAMALKARGQPAISLTGDQVRIHTDHRHGKARIDRIDTTVINQALARGQVVIVAGFQGRGPDNAITTLGRGGSDTTAVALAAALKAEECQIFTDVDGIYTTDPRLEPKARRLEYIDFESMQAMAALGAKVLEVRSVEHAGRHKVKLRVLSSFAEHSAGTLMTFDEAAPQGISGIASCLQSVLVTIKGLTANSEQARRLLEPLGDAGIDVDILCSTDDASNGLVFTVPLGDFGQALPMLQASAAAMGELDVLHRQDVAKVSVIGNDVGIRSDIATITCGALSDKQIEARHFLTSARRLTLILAQQDMVQSVRILHQTLIGP